MPRKPSIRHRLFVPSEMQMELLDALARGMPNKAIAEQLGVSLADVEYHFHRIFRLTETSNRVELAIWWSECRDKSPYRELRTA